MAEVRLTAVGTERQVSIESPGVTTLFICFAQETQAGIEQIEASARERYPDAAALLVAHVIDLHKIPGLFRKVAEATLRREYEKAAAELGPGQSPFDHVVMLPDWDGAAVAALGLTEVDRRLGLALIDARGRLLGTDQSDDPTGAALTLLASTETTN